MLLVCLQWIECTFARSSFSRNTNGGNGYCCHSWQSTKHPRLEQSPGRVLDQCFPFFINYFNTVSQCINQHQRDQFPRILSCIGSTTFTTRLCDTAALHNTKCNYTNKCHWCSNHEHNEWNRPLQYSPSNYIVKKQYQVKR